MEGEHKNVDIPKIFPNPENPLEIKFPFFDGIHRFLPALFIGNGYKIKYMNVNHRARLNGKSNYGTLSRLLWGIRDIIKVKKMIKKK